ncbi:hypothetical protein B0T24DRAFT_532214 [Lasiosphaeria ovina]|uniref:C2H2-type domain-containing protein n=1 Tax=Lasiosphaeria ovina TaxID=92902 RepID=A0AAE0N316_9PEZI|nr:hypothetical protein B0T24DRAFT_532214 [Lasiosphaeria ovina]
MSDHERRSRETSQEDCARHRFIVWAAVKRNSCVRMNAEEKLECPLLRCTQRFPDHETMLKHLACCRHLASGEFWCYDHMRVERFDDIKCKRCLGHPSKRRKMLSMAKSFFHTLGHKSKKTQGLGFDTDDTLLMPPPSYDSLGIPPSHGNPIELSSTEIVEIDSIEVSAIHVHSTEVTASDGSIDPQALIVPAMPALPELDSTMLSGESFMQWQPHPAISTSSFDVAPLEDGEYRSQCVLKPALQLTTQGLQGRRHAPRPVAAPTVPRSKGLSPSSSVRSNASTDTAASSTSNTSSLISPISNWSGAWSMGSGINTSLTSPVDGFLCDDPFADVVDDMTDDYPSLLHDFYSELPADLPLVRHPNDMACDPLFLFNDPPQADVPYAPEIELSENQAGLVDLDEPEPEPEVEQTDACCSETKALVGSAWDALQEHILSSMLKLDNVKGNPLADQLKPMSSKTVAMAGLRTVRTFLDGVQPSSASDMLCFVHLAYALSLVVHEQDASHKSRDFFLQCLSYVHFLPRSDQEPYTQLAIAIWKPSDVTREDIKTYLATTARQLPNTSFSIKGKSPEVVGRDYYGGHAPDALLTAARNFLDELESSLVLGESSISDVQVSDLYGKHVQDATSIAPVNQAFAVTVSYILNSLVEEFDDTGNLERKLSEIYRRVSDGTISAVRRVEIELLFAGKASMAAAKFLDQFVPRVCNFCDQLYEQHDSGTSRRGVYHKLGVSLVENLILEFDNLTGDVTCDRELDFLEIPSDFGYGPTSFARLDTDLQFDMESSPNLYGASEGLQPPLDKTAPADFSSPEPPSSSPAFPTPTLQGQSTQSEAVQESQGGEEKIEADSCCEICGYRPKGAPKWFKGSMAKHKKLQHSEAPPKLYKCPFPGCSSQYKNRPDNLRQHQVEKNHWVPGEEGTPRRPSKRKKTALDEE